MIIHFFIVLYSKSYGHDVMVHAKRVLQGYDWVGIKHNNLDFLQLYDPSFFSFTNTIADNRAELDLDEISTGGDAELLPNNNVMEVAVNDLFANRTVITGTNIVINTSNLGASTEVGEV